MAYMYIPQNQIMKISSIQFDRFSLFREYYLYRFKGLFSKKGFLIWLCSILIPFADFFLARASRFLPVSPKNKKLNLLDVGCGRGDFLMRAGDCGYIATGIDFDPTTVDIAKKRGLNALAVEIQELPDHIKYDAITLSHVLEHVYDPRDLLDNIFSRLNHGGYFYLATPNFDSAGQYTFKTKWRGLDAPRHLNLFSSVELEKILKEVGFQSVHQVYDLPQSIGIIKSSFKIKYNSKITLTHLFKNIFSLIKQVSSSQSSRWLYQMF